MIVITVDVETYWSTTHSLTKMSPITYCLHPDTEIQSIALKVGLNAKTEIIFGEAAIRARFDQIDWSDAWVIAHNNAEFDSMILAWRFGIKPKMWGCTQAMARPLFAKTVGVSLKATMKVLGCPFEKGSLDDVNTKGKYLADFTLDETRKMRQYNGIDTDGCAWIFKKLAVMTPPQELEAIDMTIRMLVEPEFEADVPLLQDALEKEKARKAKVLLDIAVLTGAYEPGMDVEAAQEAARKMLSSSAKFAKYLQDLGVEPPMKPSPSNPEKMTYALAKTDQAFLALQQHKDPLISSAAEARLGVKSTILETRIEKFLETAQYCNNLLPIPLRYYGADTTGRWSGWIFNPQNLPRIGKEPKLSDALRNSIRAPEGKRIVVADLSGIELRVNMFLWKVPYAMALFQADPEKADLYRYFASKALYEIEEADVSKAQRQVGKVSHLGLGFGAGAPTFQTVAKLMGGIDMPLDPDPTRPDTLCSKEIVSQYRDTHPEIVAGWKICQQALVAIYEGVEMAIDPWGLCVTTPEGIKTPVGMIRYPKLRQEYVLDDKGVSTGKIEWVYGEGRHKARIYGPKVVENIVQHLARCVLLGMMLEIKRKFGYVPKLSVHDELIYIVNNNKADEALAQVQSIMRTPPAWWPELVVWSEGSTGQTYGEAK